MDTSVQATPTQLDTVESGVQATPTIQPGVDSSSQTEGAELDNRTKTETVISEKVKVESEPMPPARPNEAWVGGVSCARTTSKSEQPSLLPQNTSLESEMRGVGIEITDPYDSSEGVGFSDSALDDVPDSTHSLEGIKDIAATKTLPEESQSAESAVPLASSIISQAIASEHVTTGGVAAMNLDLQEEEQSSEDEPSLTNSEDLRTAKRTSNSSHS